MTVACVAGAPSVSESITSATFLGEGARVLITYPTKCDGVAVIGDQEPVWRHTRHGKRYVTVIIDETRVHEGTGPARFGDLLVGCSKAALTA